MTNLQRILITNAAARACNTVTTKAASVSQPQAEVLNAIWPAEHEYMDKVAALSRILAAGSMVEEAEVSLASVGG